MKGELLSIGEVSKMKGVGVKSLRYYERMGVLPPAYVDPDSRYRYYSMHQMVDIDIITTCIDLGIPLRELRSYMDEGGIADLEALLAWSREIAVQNLRRAEITLSQLDGYLDEARTQKKLAEAPTPYERSLPKQLLLCKQWREERFNLKRYTTDTTQLYEQAKAAGIIPLYAQGLVSFAPNCAESSVAKPSPKTDCMPPSAPDASNVPDDKNEPHPSDAALLVGDDTGANPLDTRQASGAPYSGAHSHRGNAANTSASPYCSNIAGHQRTWYTFVAVAIPSWMTVRHSHEAIRAAGEGRIKTIPADTFHGWRIKAPTLSECLETLFDHCERVESTVISTEIWDAGINGANYAVEVLTTRSPSF